MSKGKTAVVIIVGVAAIAGAYYILKSDVKNSPERQAFRNNWGVWQGIGYDPRLDPNGEGSVTVTDSRGNTVTRSSTIVTGRAGGFAPIAIQTGGIDFAGVAGRYSSIGGTDSVGRSSSERIAESVTLSGDGWSRS